MASHPHAPVVTIDASLGAALIGVLLMCTLLGIVITQTHTYFRTFGNDPTWLKTAVGLVFVLEVGQSICVAHVLYLFAVTGYGDPTAMANPPKTFGADIILTLMLKFIVESYFAFRIWRLTSNKIVAGIAVILNIVAITFGIVIATNSFILKSLPEYRARMSWVIPTSFAVSLAVDVYITITLISWLARRRRVALRSTVKILDRALLWAIQTGFVTSLNSVILLITFELMPANFVWIAFYIIQPKLYSNSLLASLNARASNNRQHDSSIDLEASGGSMIAGSYQSTTRAATAHTKDLELHKQKGNETVRFAHSVPSIIEIRSQAKEGKEDVKAIDLGYRA